MHPRMTDGKTGHVVARSGRSPLYVVKADLLEGTLLSQAAEQGETGGFPT